MSQISNETFKKNFEEGSNFEVNGSSLPEEQCVHWNERSVNSDDRVRCKRGDEKDLGVSRVKIKLYCIVDSSHVACNNFRVTRRIKGVLVDGTLPVNDRLHDSLAINTRHVV